MKTIRMMVRVALLCALACHMSFFLAQNNLSVHVKTSLSPLTQQYMQALHASAGSNQAPSGFAYKLHNDGQLYNSALIQVGNAEHAQQGLDKIGATVGTKAGDIWTVHVPWQKMEAFVHISGIDYIQLDEPVQPAMDVARKTTRVDSVHSGISLPVKYSGKGVIVGVIDFGFDYNHLAMYDTLHQKYRVMKVWELNTKGTPPKGYSYGHELKDADQIRAQGTDNPKQTHGTCVAGMAAGSGYGSNAANTRFRGMAYDAEMVFVGVRRDTIARQWIQGTFSDFLDGINYIFNYARSVNKPCVINISWGSQSGPHDGSTLFNKACNNLTGPGRVLVMSAGNDGEDLIHLSKTFKASDTMVSTFLTFTSNVYKRTWVDIWGEPGKTFCGKVTLYSKNAAGQTTSFRCLDNGTHDKILVSANGKDTCFVQFISSTAESNGRPRMTIDIYNKAKDSVAVSISGKSGTIHAWDEYYYYGYTYSYKSNFSSLGQSWAVNGSTSTTVSDMGAGDSVLLIGAYASKVAFKDINGVSRSYAAYVSAGKLAPFSSRGPMVDGRVKPDITAPGITIGTSVSSFDTSYTPAGKNSGLTVLSCNDPVSGKTYYYSEFTGTSAAGPAASGIVALMLQARPILGPKQVRTIVAATSIREPGTGIIPNNNWGYGKINAYKAIRYITDSLPPYIAAPALKGLEVYPNPGRGMFNIVYDEGAEQDLNIEVYNLIGSRVWSDDWTSGRGTIDLSVMASGTYFVRVRSAAGYTVKKIIVR